MNSKQEDFVEMIKEVNPKYYRKRIKEQEVNANKSTKDRRLTKASSKSIGLDSEADSEADNNKKNKKKILKQTPDFKLIINKVLMSSLFKHVSQIEQNISNCIRFIFRSETRTETSFTKFFSSPRSESLSFEKCDIEVERYPTQTTQKFEQQTRSQTKQTEHSKLQHHSVQFRKRQIFESAQRRLAWVTRIETETLEWFCDEQCYFEIKLFGQALQLQKVVKNDF